MNRIIIFLLAIFILSNTYKPSINHATYAGLDEVQGMGKVKVELILKERSIREFENKDDFKKRTGNKIGERVYNRLTKKYSI